MAKSSVIDAAYEISMANPSGDHIAPDAARRPDWLDPVCTQE
jgi:hypothetical protein